MPLQKGKSKATIEKNTQEMIKAGHSPAQAYAAAHAVARKSGKKKSK